MRENVELLIITVLVHALQAALAYPEADRDQKPAIHAFLVGEMLFPFHFTLNSMLSLNSRVTCI
ncbi:hypothetical protein [Peribacillus muralis]|uniref:hypothetical protein n=1 Tax=Peribacillus muralis TaxID=264697 RepID=UPI00366BD5A2